MGFMNHNYSLKNTVSVFLCEPCWPWQLSLCWKWWSSTEQFRWSCIIKKMYSNGCIRASLPQLSYLNLKMLQCMFFPLKAKFKSLCTVLEEKSKFYIHTYMILINHIHFLSVLTISRYLCRNYKVQILHYPYQIFSNEIIWLYFRSSKIIVYWDHCKT